MSSFPNPMWGVGPQLPRGTSGQRCLLCISMNGPYGQRLPKFRNNPIKAFKCLCSHKHLLAAPMEPPPFSDEVTIFV